MGCFPLAMCRLLFLSACRVDAPFLCSSVIGAGGVLGPGCFRGLVYLGFWSLAGYRRKIPGPPCPFSPLEGVLSLPDLVVLVGITFSQNDIPRVRRRTDFSFLSGLFAFFGCSVHAG